MAPTKDWKKVKSAVTINAALGNMRCHNNISNNNFIIIIFAIVGCHICHLTFNPSQQFAQVILTQLFAQSSKPFCLKQTFFCKLLTEGGDVN